MERNLRNAFTLWMKERHKGVDLLPEQEEVVDAFCKMSPAMRTGKTFVIDLLSEFDDDTGSSVYSLVPYFQRHEKKMSCVETGGAVDWNPDEQKLPF